MRPSLRIAIGFIFGVSTLMLVAELMLRKFETPDTTGGVLFRGVLIFLVVVSFGVLFCSEFRRNKAPDFLRRFDKRPFEGHGLCFTIRPVMRQGVFAFEVYAQNRYSSPCNAHFVLDPSTLLADRPGLYGVQFPVDCDGGALCVTTVPFSFPVEHAGRTLTFKISAEVNYPHGRGQMLRFRNGVDVNATVDQMAGLFMGTFGMLARIPGTLRVKLPTITTNSVPPDWGGGTRTIWRPGDSEDLDFEPAASYDACVDTGRA